MKRSVTDLKNTQQAGVVGQIDLLADELKEVLVSLADVLTLLNLKGVSRTWHKLARRELCSRIFRQDLNTLGETITDLDVGVLDRAGRLWEVALAGRKCSPVESVYRGKRATRSQG